MFSINIGFFFMHPPSESMGSLYRVRNLCQGLTLFNHNCYIFTPFKYLEDWGPLAKFLTIPTITSAGKFSKLIYKTVRKILDSRIFSRYTILNPKLFNLTINRISNGLYELINEQGIKLDVIIGETEIGGLVLINIKEKLKIPIIIDYQNFWPEELIENRIIKRNSKYFNYLIELENKIISKGDLIMTPSNALRDFLLENFLKEEPSKFKSVINGGKALLEKPKIKTYPPKIINAGMVVHRSNFQLFLKSIPYILDKFPDTQVFITKKGEHLQEIINLTKKLNLTKNIIFYWKDSYKEFLDMLADCHVGVVTSTYELTRKLGFVTKIYDYLSVGVPIVGNDIGGWTSIITDENVGLLSSDDPKNLAEKIMQFLNNPNIAYEYGERGIELLKGKYSEHESANNLISIIKDLLR